MATIPKLTKLNTSPLSQSDSYWARAKHLNPVIDRINSIMSADECITASTGMMAGAPLVHGVKPANWIVYFDDFTTVNTNEAAGYLGDFAIVTDAAGTTTNPVDSSGGWLLVNATNTDNNETYLSSTNEAFIFTTNKKLYFETKISLTEVSTNTANWTIGLSSVVAADTLQNNGAGPAASYDGALFFKVDGTMYIQFETSAGGTQTTNATLNAFVSGTSYRLGFVYDYNDGTTAVVTPYVDGVAGTAQRLTISGLSEMHLLMGVKTGSTHAANLLVDYVYIAQER
jgi:hypothetical protein